MFTVCREGEADAAYCLQCADCGELMLHNVYSVQTGVS
jgi:hypothetical protein